MLYETEEFLDAWTWWCLSSSSDDASSRPNNWMSSARSQIQLVGSRKVIGFAIFTKSLKIGTKHSRFVSSCVWDKFNAINFFFSFRFESFCSRANIHSWKARSFDEKESRVSKVTTVLKFNFFNVMTHNRRTSLCFTARLACSLTMSRLSLLLHESHTTKMFSERKQSSNSRNFHHHSIFLVFYFRIAWSTGLSFRNLSGFAECIKISIHAHAFSCNSGLG